MGPIEDIVIRNALAITLDSENTIHQSADLLISGGEIIDIGQSIARPAVRLHGVRVRCQRHASYSEPNQRAHPFAGKPHPRVRRPAEPICLHVDGLGADVASDLAGNLCRGDAERLPDVDERENRHYRPLPRPAMHIGRNQRGYGGRSRFGHVERAQPSILLSCGARSAFDSTMTSSAIFCRAAIRS